MRTDFDNWTPYNVDQIAELFKEVEIHWGIGGGWALELYKGYHSRVHDDIDVIIFTRDAQYLRHKFDELTFYKAKDNTLINFADNEYIDDSYSIWVSEDETSPFVFECLLIDVTANTWFYKRNRQIYGPADQLFITNDKGIPFIKPEVQLLYKLDGTKIREKDRFDFEKTAPDLNQKAKDWLRLQLETQKNPFDKSKWLRTD